MTRRPDVSARVGDRAGCRRGAPGGRPGRSAAPARISGGASDSAAPCGRRRARAGRARGPDVAAPPEPLRRVPAPRRPRRHRHEPLVATGYPGRATPAGAGPLQTTEASAAWASSATARASATRVLEPSCPRARRRRARAFPLEPQVLLIPQFVRRPVRRPEPRRRHPQRRAARRAEHGPLVGRIALERLSATAGVSVRLRQERGRLLGRRDARVPAITGRRRPRLDDVRSARSQARSASADLRLPGQRPFDVARVVRYC